MLHRTAAVTNVLGWRGYRSPTRHVPRLAATAIIEPADRRQERALLMAAVAFLLWHGAVVRPTPNGLACSLA